MTGANGDRSVSSPYFLGQFWRSFAKALILYLTMFSFLAGMVYLDGTAQFPPRLSPDEIGVVVALAPILLFICFCYGWAGAMRRCDIEDVTAIGAFGATLLAAMTLAVQISLHFAIGTPGLPGIILWPFVVFFVSWLTIGGTWLVLGFWGEIWW